MRRILAGAARLALLTVIGTPVGLSRGSEDPRLQQPASQPTGTAAISGVVTDAATGRPLAGANVFLVGVITGPDGRSVSPFQRTQVLSDARGRFVFVDLPATHLYTVAATSSGYSVGEYEGAAATRNNEGIISGPSSVRIQLTEGEWMRDANIRMWRLGSIGGRVVDERGEPVVGVAVRAFSRRMVAGREQLVPGPLVATDDRGIYRFAALQPARYFVAVLSVQATVPSSIADGPRRLPLGGLIARGRSQPPVSRAEAQGSSIDVDGRHRLVLTNFATPPPPSAERPRAYAPVFYPNARAVDEAQSVELGFGTSLSNIDFQLAPVAAVRISGHVTGATQDAANMILRLMPRGGEHLGSGSEVATTVVETDGSFTFLNVPAGHYTLVASPSVAEIRGGGSSQGDVPLAAGAGPARGYSTVYSNVLGMSALWWRFTAGASGWGRMPISVGNADITGVDLPLQPPAVVRGRIVLDDPAQAEPNLRFTVMLEPANGDPSLGLPNTVTATAEAAFTIGGLQSGRYRFRISQFGGWRVKSVTVRGIDVTDDGIEGAPGREYGDVVVTATKKGAELSGFVRDASGRPTPAAVVLFPVDPSFWIDYGLTPDRLQSVRAGRDGSFKLTAFRDGDYYAIAVPLGQANAWPDPKFLAAAAIRATKVSLKAGSASVQNLQVSEVIVK